MEKFNKEFEDNIKRLIVDCGVEFDENIIVSSEWLDSCSDYFLKRNFGFENKDDLIDEINRLDREWWNNFYTRAVNRCFAN